MIYPSLTQESPPQSACRFGLAVGDITPPADIYHRMWGAATHERATGVHRPLRATVALFAPSTEDHLESRAVQVLVALDHCVLGAQEHEALVTHVAAATGYAPEQLLVVFSHTHGAGLMGLDRASLPGGERIPEYLAAMARCVAALTVEAAGRLVEARIVYGVGRCRLAAHRDYWDAERRHYVCGYNPGVPADDTVVVGRVTGLDGACLASVVNYACHPTTLAWQNTLISPDYPGAMRELIERETGAPCLFLQGASGELGPREGFVGDPAVADRNGRELGYAALAALSALPPAETTFRYVGPVVSGATLGAWTHVPMDPAERVRKRVWQRVRWHEPLRYRPGRPSLEGVAKELESLAAEERTARASGAEERARECRALAERKTRLWHRLKQMPEGTDYPLAVVVWRMGDAIWLGVQGESYSILQQELRARFPTMILVVASIAGDWGASYLPPRELYGTGIYQETIAVVAAGSLEQLIEAISARLAPRVRG